jgi:hypothetical protein
MEYISSNVVVEILQGEMDELYRKDKCDYDPYTDIG